MQFYPPAVFADAKLVFDIAGGAFIAKGRQLINPGWKVLMGKTDTEEKGDGTDTVPPLDKGTVLTCREGVIGDKKTEPPTVGLTPKTGDWYRPTKMWRKPNLPPAGSVKKVHHRDKPNSMIWSPGTAPVHVTYIYIYCP